MPGEPKKIAAANVPLVASLATRSTTPIGSMAVVGKNFALLAEFLRVESPSAEVQGHGPGQEVLQTGKREVVIESLETVGHYAVQPVFSDGHSSGLYSWDYLHQLGSKQDEFWQRYEQRLQEAGVDRDAPMPGKAGSACASH